MRVPAFILLLAVALPLFGETAPDSTHSPWWSARGQLAGMQGLVSVGLLWNIPDGRLQLGAMYGFGPAANGSKAYHGGIIRATGSWFPVHKPQFGTWHLSPIASISGVLEMGGIAFLTLPPVYPDGYYAPQALHAVLGLGGRLGRVGPSGGWSITAEAVALDTHLWYGIIQREVEVHRIWSLSLGLEYHFGVR